MSEMFGNTKLVYFSPTGFSDLVGTFSGWTISSQMTNPTPCTAEWSSKSFQQLLESLASCWSGCVEIDDSDSTIVFKDSGCS